MALLIFLPIFRHRHKLCPKNHNSITFLSQDFCTFIYRGDVTVQVVLNRYEAM